MTFIQTTAPAIALGEVRAMYECHQNKFGHVPNYARLFSRRPSVMAHWGALLGGIRRHVDNRRFELVTLAAAHALRNSYCSLAHSKMLSEFFSSDEILAIVSESDSCPLSAAERAMMEFARKVARDASRITAGDVAKLREFGFTDDEIFDIAATAAARTFFANLCDSLGAEADLDYRETDDELRAALTIGRPISCSEPECLAKPVTTPRPSGAGSTVV